VERVPAHTCTRGVAAFPRLAAVAEALWSPGLRDITDFADGWPASSPPRGRPGVAYRSR